MDGKKNPKELSNESGPKQSLAWWNVWGFFKARRMRRVVPISYDKPMDSLAKVFRTEVEIEYPNTSSSGVSLVEIGPGIIEGISELMTKSETDVTLPTAIPLPDMYEELEEIPPDLLNKYEAFEVSKGSDDGMIVDQESPPYYTLAEIQRRKRSTKTERKLGLIRSSLQFSQRPSKTIGQSPGERVWGLDGVDGGFVERQFGFVLEQLASNNCHEIAFDTTCWLCRLTTRSPPLLHQHHGEHIALKPSSAKKRHLFKTMKQKFLILFLSKTQDATTKKLSEDEITEMLIDKHEEKMRRKASKNKKGDEDEIDTDSVKKKL